jgi:predicted transcriptional regulator
MDLPKGNLTGAQAEVMEAVWARGPEGATVAEIWQQLAARRPLARTTVLTVVQRLEKRGWVVRHEFERNSRYVAAATREQAVGRMAAEFVDQLFGGSAVQLIQSLLGTEQITPAEIRRLRRVLDQVERERKS